MRDRDEKEEFLKLSGSARQWTTFCIEMVKAYPDISSVISSWHQTYHESLILAAAETLPKCVALFHRDGNDPGFNFSAGYYPALVNAGCFCLDNTRCDNLAAFTFLMVRLFGGKVRPFLPSIYGACLLHPNCQTATADALNDAFWEMQRDWGNHEPVYFPKKQGV